MKPKFPVLARASLGSAMLLVAIAVTSCTSENSGDTVASSTQSSIPPQTILMEPTWAFDIYDQRRVAGAADSIFVGTVIAEVGTVERTAMPETQFTVEVLSSIKGSLSGQVVVNQQGGTSKTTGASVFTEGDAALMPSKSYIFSTAFDAAIQAENFIPIVGAVELTADEAASVEAGTISRGPVSALPEDVQKMMDSAANEIPLDPNNTGLTPEGDQETQPDPDYLPPQVDGQPFG